jgi:hypothetical protein
VVGNPREKISPDFYALPLGPTDSARLLRPQGARASGAGRPRKEEWPRLAPRQAEIARPRFTPRSACRRFLAALELLHALEQACPLASDRLGLRRIHFAVLPNQVDVIVEANDSTTLSRGMQDLTIRLAKALNRARPAAQTSARSRGVAAR